MGTTPCRQRRILGAGESLSEHAARAGTRALEMAGAPPWTSSDLLSCRWQARHTDSHCVAGATAADVDMVILATSSPDDVFGSACQVGPPFALTGCAQERRRSLAHLCSKQQPAQLPSVCLRRPVHVHAPTLKTSSTPVQVQALIGARRAVAFDLTAACSGFVLALVTGAQFIRTGAAKHVLVVGADALSRYVDWRDRCASTLCHSLTHLSPAALGAAE